jgi:hypothetical protein
MGILDRGLRAFVVAPVAIVLAFLLGAGLMGWAASRTPRRSGVTAQRRRLSRRRGNHLSPNA